MGDSTRSNIMHLAGAQAHIPGPAGEHAVAVWKRARLDVALSIPKRSIPQIPHEQDKLYAIIRGSGVLFHDGKRNAFQTDNSLFMAAGVEHQFENISSDLTVWRISYGPPGEDSLALYTMSAS